MNQSDLFIKQNLSLINKLLNSFVSIYKIKYKEKKNI